MFKLGVMDGLLYIIAEDWCTVKFSESRFTQMKPDCWYMLALAYDGNSISIYLNGEKTHTFPSATGKGKAVKSESVLGDMPDAYFKDFMFFSKALTDDATRQPAAGETNVPQHVQFSGSTKIHPLICKVLLRKRTYRNLTQLLHYIL